MLGVACFKPVLFGILFFYSCIGSRDQDGPWKVRKTDITINVDLASLPGPCGILKGTWMQLHGGCITGLDVAAWPYGVGICVSLLLILCIGLLMLWTWVIFNVRDLPEFASLLSLDRSNWPRCLLWQGWLPGLFGHW